MSGNDSATNYRSAGYQTSDNVIAILGSEDFYGYSFGWSGDEVKLGQKGMYVMILICFRFRASPTSHPPIHTQTLSGYISVTQVLRTLFSLVSSDRFGTRNTGTTLHEQTSTMAMLATYRFFEHPLRFTASLHAQVNWGYDIGNNVPSDLCPPGT